MARASPFGSSGSHAIPAGPAAADGLPLPDRQERIGPYRVDFVWEHLGIVVETDGRNSHAIRIAFKDDRARDRRLAAQGEKMRVYVPYGDQWYGYLMRRLAEKPSNLGFFARSLLTKG